MGYFESLRAASRERESLLCIGLDPEPARIEGGAEGAYQHCLSIVERTADLACCFKPNAAFWEQYGPAGWEALARLRQRIPVDIPVLFDAKRADVGQTMRAYARAIFGAMNMSAATVHAYHGTESFHEFANWADRGVYVVALSTNLGGAELQQLSVGDTELYEHVAGLAAAESEHRNVGIVAGATQTHHVGRIRARYPHLPFLMPGVGSQGADITAAVSAAFNGDPASCLLSASRSVLYADDPRAVALSLREEINDAVARIP